MSPPATIIISEDSAAASRGGRRVAARFGVDVLVVPPLNDLTPDGPAVARLRLIDGRHDRRGRGSIPAPPIGCCGPTASPAGSGKPRHAGDCPDFRPTKMGLSRWGVRGRFGAWTSAVPRPRVAGGGGREDSRRRRPGRRRRGRGSARSRRVRPAAVVSGDRLRGLHELPGVPEFLPLRGLRPRRVGPDHGRVARRLPQRLSGLQPRVSFSWRSSFPSIPTRRLPAAIHPLPPPAAGDDLDRLVDELDRSEL